VRKNTKYSTGHHSPSDWIQHQRIDSPVKSQKSGDSLAERSQAMSEDAVQRSRWTFCEVVKN